MEQQVVDVVIIGAGPAGAACALALRHYADAQVLVLDSSDLEQVRVGEHVSASIFDFLDYLKVDKEQMKAECFTPNYGSTSYWGSSHANPHDSLFTTAGNTYQLKRNVFDIALLKQLVAVGGHVLPRSRSLELSQDEQHHWHVGLEHPERGKMQIKARYLVDATGRKAYVSNKLGIKRQQTDRLVGVGTFLEFDGRTLPQEQLIEATDLGWWYTATLPGNMAVATFFSDADIISQNELTKPQYWNDYLQQSQHMSKRLQSGRTTSSKLWVKNAASQMNENHQQKHFIAIGDAAAAFDPISSMGLGFALSSACHGAKVLKIALAEGNNAVLETYNKDIQNHFTNYQISHKQVYAQERRWQNAQFWQRRAVA
ncbi:MAG: flavin-dependent dehydrogenase [Paraglaciecola sp.]|jgi:flavin-dependent dehydrogenase